MVQGEATLYPPVNMPPLRKAACLPGQIGMGGCFLPCCFFFYRDNLTGQLVNPPHARGGLSQNRRGGQNHSSLKRPQMTWFKLRTCHWIKVLKKKHSLVGTWGAIVIHKTKSRSLNWFAVLSKNVSIVQDMIIEDNQVYTCLFLLGGRRLFFSSLLLFGSSESLLIKKRLKLIQSWCHWPKKWHDMTARMRVNSSGGNLNDQSYHMIRGDGIDFLRRKPSLKLAVRTWKDGIPTEK